MARFDIPSNCFTVWYTGLSTEIGHNTVSRIDAVCCCWHGGSGVSRNRCFEKVVVLIACDFSSLRFRRSTSKPFRLIKSAPRIGCATFAIVNSQLNVQPSPISISIVLEPYVGIVEPFAAYNTCLALAGLDFTSINALLGRTEMSAPVSTRNVMLFLMSVIRRQDVKGPSAVPTKITEGLPSFPNGFCYS